MDVNTTIELHDVVTPKRRDHRTRWPVVVCKHRANKHLLGLLPLPSSRSRSSPRRPVNGTRIPPTTNGPASQRRHLLLLLLLFFFFTFPSFHHFDFPRKFSLPIPHPPTFLTRVEPHICHVAVREPTLIPVSDRLDFSLLGISFESPVGPDGP